MDHHGPQMRNQATPPLRPQPATPPPQQAQPDAVALQRRVHVLERQLAAQEAQLASLSDLERALCEEAPDIEALVSAAVQRHVAEQDARNAHVLAILQSKDEQLEVVSRGAVQLQAQCQRLQDEAVELRAALQCAEEALEEAQRGRAALQRDADMAMEEAAQERARLCDQVAALKVFGVEIAHRKVWKPFLAVGNLSYVCICCIVMIMSVFAQAAEREQAASSRRSALAHEQRLAEVQRASERLATEVEAARTAAVTAQRDAATADARRDTAEREVEALQRALAAAEDASTAARQEGEAAAAQRVAALQERVEMLEGLQRVAQETALVSERRLEELEAALGEAVEQRDAAVQQALQKEVVQPVRGGEAAASPATLPDALQVGVWVGVSMRNVCMWCVFAACGRVM